MTEPDTAVPAEATKPVTRRVSSLEFPQELCKGSEGPAVTILLVALRIWGMGKEVEKSSPNPLIIDGQFGNTGEYWLKAFQLHHHIPETGWCGATDRAAINHFLGVDITAAARTLGATDNILVQTNGDKLIWRPSRQI